MATKTWQGASGSNWFVPGSWNPAGVPEAGDQVVIASPGPSVSSRDPMPLDNEQVALGGTDLAKPASIRSAGAWFGSLFQITVAPDAPYGALIFDADTVFDGTLTAVGSQLTVEAPKGFQGSGTTFIAKGATVTFAGAAPSTETVSFLDANGTLFLNDPSEFASAITGFQRGNRIQLGGKEVAASASYADGKLTIVGEGGAVIATLSLAAADGSLDFYASPFGHGGSILTTSRQHRVWKGGTGDWYDPACWADGVPLGGDTISIPSGTAILSAADASEHGTLDAVDIALGTVGSAATVTLEAVDASFGPALFIRTRGNPQYTPRYVAPRATLLGRGTTRFDGTIFHEAHGGTLVIDSQSDGSSANFVIAGNPPSRAKQDSASFATIFVGQESRLELRGETFTNNGLVLVDGNAEIASGVLVQGRGTIQAEAGGTVSVLGSVGAEQIFLFGDDNGTLRLGNLPAFKALIEVAAAGDRVLLPDAKARSLDYDATTRTLSLLDDTGRQIGELSITDPNGAGVNDFTLKSNGERGSLITYTPQGAILLKQSLPVAAVGTTGALLPLKQLLTQAFGTIPAGYASYRLSAPFQQLPNESYWEQPPTGNPTNSRWIYDGEPITGPKTVRASDLDHVSLYVGNSIVRTAYFTVPIAFDGPDNPTAYIQYNIWTVDPSVDAPETAWPTPDPNVPGSARRFGRPDACDIVSSAYRYSTVYAGVHNTNNCNWIADNVTAGAGAVMPYDNASTDPADNESGGFWRIVYRGSGSPDPVSDWFTLTRPGDVVRMGRLDENGQHTTTVVGTINPDGTITVYDNGDHTSAGQVIGVHEPTYWTGTDPATITIYRLDPKHRYLIQGTSRGGFIQGSVFDNLIRPGGGRPTIAAGPGRNEIEATTTHLDGITVTGFHRGDTLNVTDLSDSDARATFANGVLTVFRLNVPLATINLPGLAPGASFCMDPNGDGGTLVRLASAS